MNKIFAILSVLMLSFVANAQPTLPAHWIPTYIPPLFDIENSNHVLTTNWTDPGVYTNFYHNTYYTQAFYVFNEVWTNYTSSNSTCSGPFTWIDERITTIEKESDSLDVSGNIFRESTGNPCLYTLFGIYPPISESDFPVAGISSVGSVNADNLVSLVYPNSTSMSASWVDFYLGDESFTGWTLASAQVTIMGFEPESNPEEDEDVFVTMTYSYDLVYEYRNQNNVVTMKREIYCSFTLQAYSPTFWP